MEATGRFSAKERHDLAYVFKVSLWSLIENRPLWGNSRSRETSATIQVRGDSRWDQSGGSKSSDMRLDSRYIMKTKLIIFANESTVRHKRREASKEEERYQEWYINKKEWSNAICSNMVRHRDDHTKWSKSDKDTYHTISLICRILKWYKWTYLPNRDRLTDLENKLTVTKREWGA